VSGGNEVQSYVLEASLAEHQRLISSARRTGLHVREMCARAGVGMGARVIDIGCGPVGALLELAELTGPEGTVVGLDSSTEAVETARAIVSTRGLSNVSVMHGDIHAADPKTIASDGLFDAAHVRLMLAHQTDSVGTLQRVMALLRPGGRMLLFEAVEDPRYPTFDPPVPACQTARELVFAAMRHHGAGVDSARRLPRLCEEAGLRVLDARGGFSLTTPASELVEITRLLLLSARKAIVAFELATDAVVDALAEALAAAQGGEFRSVLGWLFVQVIAQAPEPQRE